MFFSFGLQNCRILFSEFTMLEGKLAILLKIYKTGWKMCSGYMTDDADLFRFIYKRIWFKTWFLFSVGFREKLRLTQADYRLLETNKSYNSYFISLFEYIFLILHLFLFIMRILSYPRYLRLLWIEVLQMSHFSKIF